MKNVILSNLMCFSSVLVIILALAKALTLAQDISETPYFQGFSPFLCFADFLQKRENPGRKRMIRNQIHTSFSAPSFSRFLSEIFATFYSFLAFEKRSRYTRYTPRFETMQKGYNGKEIVDLSVNTDN